MDGRPHSVWVGEVRGAEITDADRRALSPLFWTHVNPYGRFELDMNSRLDLDLSLRVAVPGPRTGQPEAAAAPDSWPKRW
ncbi:hypothetical protein [Streptomyces sp. NPDC050804]|uniref:hypothetical protein n=1 Tax=unclassified Streptomyces TaxID=2593676 RepID=UPI00342C40B0|nr:transposase [Streptomyces sp. NBC_00872]